MQREIEFRGWDIEHGQWVYGYYEDYMNAFGPHLATIHVKMDWNLNGSFRVDPASVGQWTGLYDRNKKRIYEGDILKDRKIIHNDGSENDPYIVTWNDYSDEIEIGMVGLNVGWLEQSDIEIVGNTYEQSLNQKST